MSLFTLSCISKLTGVPSCLNRSVIFISNVHLQIRNSSTFRINSHVGSTLSNRQHSLLHLSPSSNSSSWQNKDLLPWLPLHPPHWRTPMQRRTWSGYSEPLGISVGSCSPPLLVGRWKTLEEKENHTHHDFQPQRLVITGTTVYSSYTIKKCLN